MKLPDRVKVGVQSLGRRDVQGELSVGRAIAGAIDSVSNTVTFIAQRKEQEKQRKIQDQERTASLSMANAGLTFEERYGGKSYLTPDEIPEDIQIRRTEMVMGDDGQLIETQRSQIPSYEVLPDLYRQYTSKQIEALSTTIEDEEVRKRWIQDTTLVADEQYVQRLVRSRGDQTKFLIEKTQSDVNSALVNKQYELASELASTIPDEILRTETLQRIEFESFNQPFNELALDINADPDDIESAISDLRNPEIAMPLSDAQRLAKANTLETNLARVNAKEMEHIERVRQEKVSDAWLAISKNNPQVDEQYVQTLFDNKDIDGGTRTAMIKAIWDSRNNAVKEQAAMIDLDRLAGTGVGIDPKDKELRAAVDARYAEQAEESEDPWGSAMQVMRTYKVVPSQITSMFRAANRADSPQLGQAVELFITAQDYAPNSLEDFKEGEVNFIEDVAANVRLGMDVTSAVAAVESWKSLTPQERSVLSKNSVMMKESNSKMLADQISSHPAYDIPWSVFDPEPTMIMTSEYESLVQRYLPTVGFNVSVAQNKAFSEMSKSWSLTDINGSWSLMRDMPRVPSEQIRSSISEIYGEDLARISDYQGMKISPNSVKIYSDALTRIQINRNEKPSYRAYVVLDEENGIIEELPRFEWDAKSNADNRRQRYLDEAQQRRAEILEARSRKEEQKRLEQGVRDLMWDRASNMPFER